MILRVGIIYKITYPNGKIYIGQDRTDDANYFGSADSFTIAKDFSRNELDDFTIRKQVIARHKNITIGQLNALESHWINALNSRDPSIGYNRNGVRRRLCRTVFLTEGE